MSTIKQICFSNFCFVLRIFELKLNYIFGFELIWNIWTSKFELSFWISWISIMIKKILEESLTCGNITVTLLRFSWALPLTGNPQKSLRGEFSSLHRRKTKDKRKIRKFQKTPWLSWVRQHRSHTTQIQLSTAALTGNPQKSLRGEFSSLHCRKTKENPTKLRSSKL